MAFEEILVSKLNEISSLTNKVFPLNAKEGTEAPYIVYVSQDIVEIQTHSGFLGCGDIAIEINMLAKTYKELKSLSKQVRDKLKTIDNLIFEDPQPEIWEPEVKLYRKIINFKVFYEEV